VTKQCKYKSFKAFKYDNIIFWFTGIPYHIYHRQTIAFALSIVYNTYYLLKGAKNIAENNLGLNQDYAFEWSDMSIRNDVNINPLKLSNTIISSFGLLEYHITSIIAKQWYIHTMNE
jgi:hypothetical protein